MAKTWQSMDEALREEIVCAGTTYSAVSRASGVPTASIFRFIEGQRGITLESADKLARSFGLVVVKKPKAKPKRTTKRKPKRG